MCRDCTGLNLMMDGSDMFPQGWHPADPMMNRQYTADARHYMRTQRPPKYYWIDFGLSLQFNENDTNPKSLPMRGNDRTVPELQGKDYQSVALNPFPADIYYLGNLVRRHFTEVCKSGDGSTFECFFEPSYIRATCILGQNLASSS